LLESKIIYIYSIKKRLKKINQVNPDKSMKPMTQDSSYKLKITYKKQIKKSQISIKKLFNYSNLQKFHSTHMKTYCHNPTKKHCQNLSILQPITLPKRFQPHV
jgi:hypothetical protein